MCNAYNHPPECKCGWGGEGHLGGGGNRIQGKSWSDFSNKEVRQLKGLNGLFSRTIPNAKCPVCGAEVFFYSNEYGSRVFFDELGPPWPKHPCTDNRMEKDIPEINPKILASQKLIESDYNLCENLKILNEDGIPLRAFTHKPDNEYRNLLEAEVNGVKREFLVERSFFDIMNDIVVIRELKDGFVEFHLFGNSDKIIKGITKKKAIALGLEEFLNYKKGQDNIIEIDPSNFSRGLYFVRGLSRINRYGFPDLCVRRRDIPMEIYNKLKSSDNIISCIAVVTQIDSTKIFFKPTELYKRK